MLTHILPRNLIKIPDIPHTHTHTERVAFSNGRPSVSNMPSLPYVEKFRRHRVLQHIRNIIPVCSINFIYSAGVCVYVERSMPKTSIQYTHHSSIPPFGKSPLLPNAGCRPLLHVAVKRQHGVAGVRVSALAREKSRSAYLTAPLKRVTGEANCQQSRPSGYIDLRCAAAARRH